MRKNQHAPSRKKESNGTIFLLCRNATSVDSTDTFYNERGCNTWVRVGNKDVYSVVCGSCVAQSMPMPEQVTRDISQNKGYPRGWALRKVFVDSDGNVFHKGVEQPKLKGTLEPTAIKKVGIVEKRKKKRDKEAQRQEYMQRVVDLKYALRHEDGTKERLKIEKELSNIEKKMRSL